jgi:SAM-dependent methyltransferase
MSDNIISSFKCTVCNNESDFYRKLQEVTLYQCDNCNHRFTDVNTIINNETYSNDYFEEKHKNWFDNPNILLFEYIYEKINSLGLDNPSVLDVGCGNGDFLRYLSNKSRKMQLNGVDYHENQSEEGINFICGDIFNPKLFDQYDVIINLSTLPNIWDVQSYANCLVELCENNGLIITITINDTSLVYRVARVMHFFGIKAPMERLYEKHHLNHFSWKSLEHLFESNSTLNFLEHVRTPDNIDAVDLPTANFLIKKFYKLSLKFLFLFSRLLNKPLFQSLVMKKVIN